MCIRVSLMPLNFTGVVHHGIALQEYKLFNAPGENYLTWMGRFAPEKGAHLAIEAAQRAGLPLVLAGIVDRHNKESMDYFRNAIKPHVDLLDVISFFGASRKWNLDFACKAFGVESPKEHGMDGYSVGPYYRAGRLREIALYCRRDVEATARLFRKIEKTLLPVLKDTRL